MEQEFSNVAPAKKNNTVIIIVAIVAALLCCCCVLIVGSFAFLGPTISETFENINEGIEQGVPYELPGDNGEGGDTEDYSESYPDLSSYIPTGGLGDEVLRTDTWFNINFSAAMANCTIPSDGAGRTDIVVLQDPDSSGVWVERWTVPCDDNTTKAFDVTFTPASGGGTDISISTAE